jgi:hypothetical protein
MMGDLMMMMMMMASPQELCKSRSSGHRCEVIEMVVSANYSIWRSELSHALHLNELLKLLRLEEISYQ